MAKTAKKKWYESYQPLNDYVLVKVIKDDEKTKGGLYKPESNKEQMKGEVLAVGSGIFTTTGTEIPMKLRVGDNVIVPNNSKYCNYRKV